MSDILVIGGSGFVGSALVPALLEAGHKVTLLNRGTKPVDNVDQLIADRNEEGDMKKLSRGFDVVVDTSAYVLDHGRIAFETFGMKTELWINLSSASVYLETVDSLPTELSSTGGAKIWANYGEEQTQVDSYLLDQKGPSKIVIRPPYLYGPNNADDRETFVWSRTLNSQPIIVPGKGDAGLQYLHVEDLGALITYFVENPTQSDEIYNAAERTIISTFDWSTEVANMVGRPPEIVIADEHTDGFTARDYFPYRDYTCALDVSKIYENTSWKPKYSFKAGFKQTLSTYPKDELKKSMAVSNAEKAIYDRYLAAQTGR